MNKRLVKIYRNRAVYLVDGCGIDWEEIPADALAVLNYYKNTLKKGA